MSGSPSASLSPSASASVADRLRLVPGVFVPASASKELHERRINPAHHLKGPQGIWNIIENATKTGIVRATVLGLGMECDIWVFTASTPSTEYNLRATVFLSQKVYGDVFLIARPIDVEQRPDLLTSGSYMPFTIADFYSIWELRRNQIYQNASRVSIPAQSS